MLARKRLEECSMIYCVEKLVGRKELRKLLTLQRLAAHARDALCCAIALSFAALYAVLGNPRRAPDHLLAAAQKVKQSFRGWRKAAYAGAALSSIVPYIVLAVLMTRGSFSSSFYWYRHAFTHRLTLSGFSRVICRSSSAAYTTRWM